jgi:hypothetical protein
MTFIERREGRAPNQQRGHDRPRFFLIIPGQNLPPVPREFEQLVADVPALARATPLRNDHRGTPRLHRSFRRRSSALSASRRPAICSPEPIAVLNVALPLVFSNVLKRSHQRGMTLLGNAPLSIPPFSLP